MDHIDQFKAAQRMAWANFASFEGMTTPTAARLVKHAHITKGQRVLDIGCGTGVVSVTARLAGAETTGLDLTPELLARAKENAHIADLKGMVWVEGDAEKLPFEDASFDCVLSQFGHMFAPRHDVALAEALRVLKPGGTIAFSTWPPHLFTGRMFALNGKYLPPPPEGITPPTKWGDPSYIKELFGTRVRDLTFNTDTMWFPILSPRHHRLLNEVAAAPIVRIVAELKDNPSKLAEFRAEYEAIAASYFEDNRLRHDFLMTRAIKI